MLAHVQRGVHRDQQEALGKHFSGVVIGTFSAVRSVRKFKTVPLRKVEVRKKNNTTYFLKIKS